MMRIVETYLPKYQVVFEHPDTGCSIHDFFIEDKNAPGPFDDKEEWDVWYSDLKKQVWQTFNAGGYYHTMTIKEQYVIDGKEYIATICEEASHYDVFYGE